MFELLFGVKQHKRIKNRPVGSMLLSSGGRRGLFLRHTAISEYDEAVMRQYIRHPSHIPIEFQLDDATPPVPYRTTDVSEGGLCFQAEGPMPRGKRIRLNIPLCFQAHGCLEESRSEEHFEAEGVVAWCRKELDRYAVGVQFLDSNTRFGVRMVEQVCHIEHYRHDVLLEEGRSLTSEEAAREWVERYAAEFPC